MYSEFSLWLTDLEAFKLGLIFGFLIGLLMFFILTAIVEYFVDLFNKKRINNKEVK